MVGGLGMNVRVLEIGVAMRDGIEVAHDGAAIHLHRLEYTIQDFGIG